MRRHLAVLLLLSTVAAASDKPEPWLEVRSPHFIVITNANEKQGRTAAGQFERMRSVFHTAFPKIALDSFAPITVIAVKDDKNFKALEPEAYLAKGSLKLGGLFIRGTEKNYVLARLDSGYEHPYSVIYHEYTHLLTSKASDYMPLWLNEGIAEFYENTDIHDKDVALGQPSGQNIELLRERKLLPLEQLFTIGHDSPYYREQDKGSIFYAESWALTHYLMITDYKTKGHRVRDYVELLSQKADPVAAATTAFGDLKVLQKALEGYVGQLSFQYFKMPAAMDVNEAAFSLRPMTAGQAAAVRADFLAYNQRTNDARLLLEQVMKDDPQNASARETMGLIEQMQGHSAEARKWYEEAVKLDSQSYLAHYYFAAMAMNGELSPEDETRVEASLRASIKLNPAFAPAFDRLAVFFASRRKNLPEAYLLSIAAVQNDPGNVWFRINSANVLMASERAADARRVLEAALRVAKNPQEISSVQNMLSMVERYQAMRDSVAEHNRAIAEANAHESGPPVLQHAASKEEEAAPPRLASRKATEIPPHAPRKSVVGKLSNIQCSTPAVLEAKLVSASGSMQLHSDNYYKIAFSALGFNPEGELHPCSDLEGATAKVEYVEIPGDTPQIIAVELRK